MVALALRGCHRFFPVIWASILSVTSYIPLSLALPLFSLSIKQGPVQYTLCHCTPLLMACPRWLKDAAVSPHLPSPAPCSESQDSFCSGEDMRL